MSAQFSHWSQHFCKFACKFRKYTLFIEPDHTHTSLGEKESHPNYLQVATKTLLGGREGLLPWSKAQLSKKRTSPFSHLNWMLSSSIISWHLFTTFSAISVPSAIKAELCSFPCIPTMVLNHILRPFLPSNTFVRHLGPNIVFIAPFGSHSTSIPDALALQINEGDAIIVQKP